MAELTEAESEGLIEAIQDGTQDAYVVRIVTARMADAWDAGAYAAGYCCCDPEDNPYRQQETP